MIRDDLEKAIKEKFNIRKLSYIGTGKSNFGKKLLIFEAMDNTITFEIAFEAEDKDNFYIYEVEKNSFFNKPCYLRKTCKTLYLHKNSEETILDISFDIKGEVFQGEAFDFDKELVVLRLEG